MEKESKKSEQKTVKITTDPKFEKWSFCPNALPHPSTWSSRPLLFRLSSEVHNVPKSAMSPAWRRFEDHGNKYLELKTTGKEEKAQGCLPVNSKVFDFESPLFKGRAILRLPSEETKDYFEGKRRKSSMLIQGKFKKDMEFRSVYTGQEFCHPVKSPGYFITKAALALFKTLSPSMEANIVAENEKEVIPNQTHFMSPLAGTASIINISTESKKPKLGANTKIIEDMTLLGGDFKDSLKNYPDMEKRIVWRRKHFQKIKNLEQYTFKKDYVFTFDFYNDKLLMDSLHLAVLGQKFDLTRYLAGQPLRILAKARGGTQYLWNFELWHERQTEEWKEEGKKK